MAEIVLKGDVNLAGGDEESRHLLLADGGNLYRIPISSEGAKKLGAMLVLDDEQLAAESAKLRAAERLVMPGNGGPPHTNLN